MIAFTDKMIKAIASVFDRGSGFKGGKVEKKITRTKVVYYPTCQGCGAARPQGKDTCEYCGRSFIKSEETITEKDIPPQESAIKGKKTDGEYAYSSEPNTFLRVHVVPVPVVSHSHRSSSSGGGSSCVFQACTCGRL